MINLIKTALAAVGQIPKDGVVPECGPSGPIILDGEDTALEVIGRKDIPQCGWDQILELGENIVNTLIGAAFIITTLFLIIGAFKLITSQGAPERISSAKGSITSAIIGLIIVLTAWVVLNSTINFFVDKDRCEREWWKFQGLECRPTPSNEVEVL